MFLFFSHFWLIMENKPHWKNSVPGTNKMLYRLWFQLKRQLEEGRGIRMHMTTFYCMYEILKNQEKYSKKLSCTDYRHFSRKRIVLMIIIAMSRASQRGESWNQSLCPPRFVAYSRKINLFPLQKGILPVMILQVIYHARSDVPKLFR